jgi:RNA polymerase sigma-70 factor (ECF subfamily)
LAADAGAARTARFARLIDRYQGPLLRYVGRVVGAEDDQTEDIVQECFLRLHKAWGGRDEPPMDRVGAWLFTVAHNLTMDVIRKRKHQRDLKTELSAEVVEADAGDEQSVYGQATQSEASAAALAALDRLPPEQKQVVLMKVLEGLTFRQIAKATGSSLGSVNYRLNKALTTLARQLKQTGHL